MKKYILIFSLYSSFILQANDIERINLLVTEVKHLQSNYSMCQRKLFILEDKLKKSTNTSIEMCAKELSKEHESFIELQKRCQKRKEDEGLEKALVHTLQKKMEHKDTLLAQKEQEIIKLQDKLKRYEKHLKNVQQLNQQLINEKQKSKRLEKKLLSLTKSLKKSIKNDHQKSVIKSIICKKEDVPVIQREVQHLVLTKQKNIAIQKQTEFVLSRAKTYRTKNETDIYDAINGKKIDRWGKGRSFTSYISSDNWIKITGYFINKQWQKSSQEMWIKKEDAFER